MRTNKSNIGNKSIVFIPDYIKAGLENGGLSLIELDGMTPTPDASGSEINKIHETVMNRLSSVLSNNDLQTLLVSISMIPRSLFGINYSNNYFGCDGVLDDAISSYLITSNAYLTDRGESYRELINELLFNSSITMSEINNNKEKGYELVITSNTLFVVLHEGCGNIIINNSTGLREAMLLDLVNTMFNSFSEDFLYNHDVFRHFLSLTKK